LLSAKQIAPGKTGEIEVTVKTENAQAINKTVEVLTNDPRQPKITLTLTGTVEPEFALTERMVFFGNVARGKEAVKELLITIPPDKPVKIVSAESTDQNVTVRLEPVPGSNDKKVKLIAVQKADAKDGYHFGMIVVKTTSSLTPELKITVRGNVVSGQGSK
jgi:hypothetical protein